MADRKGLAGRSARAPRHGELADRHPSSVRRAAKDAAQRRPAGHRGIDRTRRGGREHRVGRHAGRPRACTTASPDRAGRCSIARACGCTRGGRSARRRRPLPPQAAPPRSAMRSRIARRRRVPRRSQGPRCRRGPAQLGLRGAALVGSSTRSSCSTIPSGGSQDSGSSRHCGQRPWRSRRSPCGDRPTGMRGSRTSRARPERCSCGAPGRFPSRKTSGGSLSVWARWACWPSSPRRPSSSGRSPCHDAPPTTRRVVRRSGSCARTVATRSPSSSCGGTPVSSSPPTGVPSSRTRSRAGSSWPRAIQLERPSRSRGFCPSSASSPSDAGSPSGPSVPVRAFSISTVTPGLHALYIGDEAIVDTRSFSLEGRAIRKVRQSVNRLTSAGFSTELCSLGDLDAATLEQLERVSVSWREGAPGARLRDGDGRARVRALSGHDRRDRARRRTEPSADSSTSCRRMAGRRCPCPACAATAARPTA